ncbi:MAG: Tol-Pal system protein TolB [Sulfuricurvum sp.]|nr:Tol-Pal system protein TolB [Sulfuricurvum sp.]MDD5386646.1 Tol-Pal system protein TolB [Sulfuricurvum sp.]
MRYWIVFILSIITLFGADTTLEVTKTVGVLPKFVIEDGSAVAGSETQKFHKMLSADMKVVSLFDVDDSYAIQTFESGQPSLAHQEAAYILRYRLVGDGNGGFKADVKLLQNNLELFNKSYLLKQSEMLVFLSHSIAYDINAKMGGAPLEWMKRKVLLVRLSGARHSEIVAADYTLAYQKVILSGGLYGFAKWANREQTDFYYTALSDFKPTIYKVNLASGAKRSIVSSDGMAVCSDVSEDGTKLLLTLAPNGQPDIYLYDLILNEKKRVTDYSGIDVNGQFMGNDTIAFVSNRFGNPNIFSKKMESNAITQLVFEGKNNSSFTTYRHLLVYKTRDGDGFDLRLASLNNSGTRQLTSSGDNDYPRFSYDGEAILHIKQEGSRSLVGIIRLGLNKSFTFPLHVGRIQSLDW